MSDELTDAEMLARHRGALVRRNWIVRIVQVLVLVAFLALWEIASGRWIETFWISSPSLVAVRLWEWFSTGFIWPHLGVTLLETFLGFAVGTVLALILGITLGLFPLARRIANPFLTAIYALPKIALAPLFIVYLGIGLAMKVTLVGLIVFFLVFYIVLDATRSVDADLRAVVRVSGARPASLLRVLILPSSFGSILTAMKVALPYAFQGAIFAEILASIQGLGYLIQYSAAGFDITGIFAGIVVITVVAVAANQLVEVLEQRTQAWRLG